MPGELAIIEDIRRRAARTKHPALRLGIGDDCAILRPPRNHELVITTDLSLESRHFGPHHPARAVGHRCLARGLSDLASMGATPLAAFLSIALPSQTAKQQRWLQGFLDGLFDLARAHKVPLAGGDTAQAPGSHTLADIVLIGSVPTGRAILRANARPGDIIYVTGSLGGSAAELARLPRKLPGNPHLYPHPRLAIGRRLLRLATSCIDISDGLSTDLNHICQSSKVGAIINQAQLPIHPAATLDQALHGGEDYELLFTASPSNTIPRRITGVQITRIGHITRNRKLLFCNENTSNPLPIFGWQHFFR